MRECIVSALKSAGYTVLALPSPIGATSALLRNAVKLVVLDLQMPTMNGDKLAALFRKNERLRDLKVILASGTCGSELKRLGREAGADAVVDKAHGVELIVRTVRTLLQTP